jgi:hypothetical protein
MIRDSLATGSKHFFLCLTGAWGLRVQYRPTESGITHEKNVSPTPSEKTLNVKITKTGNVFQAYYKRIGDTNWSKFGSAQTIGILCQLLFWYCSIIFGQLKESYSQSPGLGSE